MPDDVAELIDRDEGAGALRGYTSRLCAILRTSPDPEAPALGTWTLRDVANHLASGVENYARWLQGLDAPDLNEIRKMSRWNMETVRAMPPTDLAELADRIEAATSRFIDAASDKPPGSYVRWYADNRIPVQVAVCMRLIEAAVHGSDVATAAKQGWDIDRVAARTMSYGLGYISPHFVDEEKLTFEGTIRMRIRGGADLYYIVENHQLLVATSGPPPGWTLSVDPVAWVLVSTGRSNQWSAALRGKMFGWGTRPGLPFKLRAASIQG